MEMVTCGEDGLATNEGEVLLHGEHWWGGHREIYYSKGERERERNSIFFTIKLKVKMVVKMEKFMN